MIERGEVWLTDFNPVRPGEQGGTRPALVVSTTAMNSWPVGLVMLVPLTTRARGYAHHIPIPDAGLDHPSWAMPEYVRSVTQQRLRRHLGTTDTANVDAVSVWLRRLLGL